LFKRWLSHIRDITYHDAHVYLIDNSPDMEYIKHIWANGVNADYINPKDKNPSQYIAESQNIIRKKVLDGFDYLLMIETDVFVPPNILEYLLAFKQGMINLSYLINFGDETAMCLQMMTNRTGKLRRTLRVGPDVSFGIYKGGQPEIGEVSMGPDISLYGSGVGCSLIHRDILEAVEFRYDDSNSANVNLEVFSDSYFHLDVQRKGFNNTLEQDEFLRHERKSWQEYVDIN